MRASLAFALTALAVATAVAPAAAQQPPRGDGEIVVLGVRPTRDAVRDFVGQIAAAPRAQNQLSRWDRRICPGVAGLRRRYAQFLIDRMAQRALQVGLDTGEPGCRANILIVVSPDPDAVARDLYQNHRNALGYFDQPRRSTRGRTALRETFLNSDAPVRWWHVNHAMSASGEEVWDSGTGAGCHGRRPDEFALMRCWDVNWMGGGASRLRSATRQDFGAAFIIVDARRLEAIDFDWGALADYVAMVALAQLDPEAETARYPTILNLFAERSTVRALTDWDVAYLSGLYRAEPDAATVAYHEGEIARRMNGDLNAPPQE